MPYCPKCDMEFIDGITVCTDCGGPLVESEEAARAMKAAEKAQKMARERAMYEALIKKAGEIADNGDEPSPDPEDLEEDAAEVNGGSAEGGDGTEVSGGSAEGVDGEEVSAGSAEGGDGTEVSGGSAEGGDGEEVSGGSAEGGDGEEEAEQFDISRLTPQQAKALLDAQAPLRRERNHVYVDKSQKYNDLKSSASAFLIVGCVLAVVSVLLWTGIVSLPMATVSRMIFRGALTLMAVFSLAVYFNTTREARKLAPQIDEEKQRTEELIRWFTDNYSKDEIDGAIPDRDALPEEELSLKRFQLIQDYLVTNQDLPDPDYVDALSEEIYGKIFE